MKILWSERITPDKIFLHGNNGYRFYNSQWFHGNNGYRFYNSQWWCYPKNVVKELREKMP